MAGASGRGAWTIISPANRWADGAPSRSPHVPKLSVEEISGTFQRLETRLIIRELIKKKRKQNRRRGRCCHCDCRSASNCKLHHFGELYGADPKAFCRRTLGGVLNSSRQPGAFCSSRASASLAAFVWSLQIRRRGTVGFNFSLAAASM